MTSAERPSNARIWWLAIRPATLPAAIAPVLVGIGAALGVGVAFRADTGLACLGVALLLQIAANLANDVSDFRRGADYGGADGAAPGRGGRSRHGTPARDGDRRRAGAGGRRRAVLHLRRRLAAARPWARRRCSRRSRTPAVRGRMAIVASARSSSSRSSGSSRSWGRRTSRRSGSSRCSGGPPSRSGRSSPASSSSTTCATSRPTVSPASGRSP